MSHPVRVIGFSGELPQSKEAPDPGEVLCGQEGCERIIDERSPDCNIDNKPLCSDCDLMKPNEHNQHNQHNHICVGCYEDLLEKHGDTVAAEQKRNRWEKHCERLAEEAARTGKLEDLNAWLTARKEGP